MTTDGDYDQYGDMADLAKRRIAMERFGPVGMTIVQLQAQLDGLKAQLEAMERAIPAVPNSSYRSNQVCPGGCQSGRVEIKTTTEEVVAISYRTCPYCLGMTKREWLDALGVPPDKPY